MSDDSLPPCGIYRTTEAIGEVPAGRLVYFHNHGEPGPGVYLPASWKGNRARFAARGHLLAQPGDAHDLLVPLSGEGFYRVTEPFFCCANECRRFEPGSLVQLGYDGNATPIVFVPRFTDGFLVLPERGTKVEPDRLAKLERLRVPVEGPVHESGADEHLLH